MRLVLPIALAAILAAPALAQEKTTLQHMVEKGIIVKFPGIDLDVFYLPDGKFSALGGTVSGSWRIEG